MATVTLEAALAELSRLESRRSEIVENDTAKLRELQALQRDCLSAVTKCNLALNDGTGADEFRELLKGWAQNYALLKPLEQLVMGLSHSTAGDPGRVGKLRSEFGDLKSPLVRACQLQLERAASKLELITQEEQARLDAIGDFDASTSPVVTRAAARVSHLKAMLQRITTEPIEQTFVNFVQQLLE